VLVSDLQEAGLIQQDEEGGINIVVPPQDFKDGVRDLVTKLKTFRYEGERRLRLLPDYAQSKECRSVFLRRYFGEDHPPRCGTCDRCRADHVGGFAARPFTEHTCAPEPTAQRESGGPAAARRGIPHDFGGRAAR
jgi:hypothetical protein